MSHGTHVFWRSPADGEHMCSRGTSKRADAMPQTHTAECSYQDGSELGRAGQVPRPCPQHPLHLWSISHTHTHVSTHAQVHTHTHTHTHTHVRTHVPTHTNTHTRTHTLIRTHTHKRTKTFGVQMNCHPDLRKNTVYANKQ